MRLLVTGAGGFLGQEIARQALLRPEISALRLVDLHPVGPAASAVETLTGDLCDPSLMKEALAGVDAVIHLASILGGAAEADPIAARRVNLDMTLPMSDHLRKTAPATRFVFASSIAVLGDHLPDPVTDDTPLAPVMVYGSHKAMVEIALSNHARRGWLDALSLRPSGIVARDGVDAALKSAFLSRICWAVKRGEDITLPVAEDSRTWMASVQNVAANFLHGAFANPGPSRAMTLPCLSLTIGELVAALRRRYPDSPSRITFAPEPEAVALFGSFPGIVTGAADAAGFSRDKGADALVAAAMREGDTE